MTVTMIKGSKLNGWKILVMVCLFAFSVISASAKDDEDNKDELVSGKITTADGQPAAYITVHIKGIDKAVITGEDGSFEFHRLKPGEYDIEVSLVGYETITQHIMVEKDKPIVLSFQLKASEKELQEVIVTSGRNKFTKKESDYVSKMPLKNMENPQVYTTITKQLLTEQLVFSVDDAMRNATGVTKLWEATGRSGDGGSYYNSRGFIMQSQLRDGVAGNVSAKIDASNLERIEIIKGPSATLFGSNLTSYGGLINRVTKKPYEKFGGEVATSVGSFGLNRVSVDVNTPLDSTGKAALRINTAYNYNGSFQDNGYNRSIAFAPSFSYMVNDKLSFLVDVEYYTGRNMIAPIYFFPYGQTIASMGVNRADKLSLDYNRSFMSGDMSQQSTSSNLFGQMNYKFNSKWSTQTNISSTYSYSDGFGAYYYLLSNAAVTGNASAIGSDYISRNDQHTTNSKQTTLEIQQNITGEFNIGQFKNRFVGGLDYFYNHPDEFFYGGTVDTILSYGTVPTYRNFNPTTLQSLYNNGGGSSYYIYPVNTTSYTYSAYASDVLNITDNLLVLAALRVDNFVNKGTYDVTSGATSGGFNQTALAPKFGIVYQPVKGVVSLFANYQNGFTNKTGTDFNGKIFKPEQANQVEAGVKLDAFNGRLSGTISYYDIKVKDLVRGDVAHPNFSIQDGIQVSKGIEAEVIASPFNGLNMIAGFSYNDSKYTQADADVQGLRPSTASSPYNANLWISYRLPQGAAKGLGIGFGGNYSSDNKVINSKSIGVFTLPAYTVLNASVFYDQKKYRLGFKVDNIGNQKYYIGYGTVNPQQLRSFAGSVAFKF